MKYNDYELISLAREGNEDAINIIYNKYKPIIINKSKDAIVLANHHGIEISDIMQEGYIGLEEAIYAFSENDKSSFYTFAMLCINRQIINYLRKTTGGKDKILNEAVAIDDIMESSISNGADTEFSFIFDEEKREMLEIINKKLTDFEKDVFSLKIDGYTFEEIANTLNKDIKSIYNTFQRIKFKIKNILKQDDYLK